MVHCLVLFLVAGACVAGDSRSDASGASSVASATADTSVQGFWTHFRAAALAADTAQVASLTQFPLRTRGPMDSDPVVSHDRAAFPALFARLMLQDHGLSPVPGTMRALIERTPSLGARELGGNDVRVGALEFARTAAGWRLVFAYTED